MPRLPANIPEAIAALPGDAPWDILPGQFSAPMPVCGEYASARAAHDALVKAGFEPTGKAIAAPPMMAVVYDLGTLLRFTAGEGRDVLLVRRAPR